MIVTLEEYENTRAYEERLQQILLELRRTHTSSQYESLSRGYLKELARAQRAITLYLATPAEAGQQAV